MTIEQTLLDIFNQVATVRGTQLGERLPPGQIINLIQGRVPQSTLEQTTPLLNQVFRPTSVSLSQPFTEPKGEKIEPQGSPTGKHTYPRRTIE